MWSHVSLAQIQKSFVNLFIYIFYLLLLDLTFFYMYSFSIGNYCILLLLQLKFTKKTFRF